MRYDFSIHNLPSYHLPNKNIVLFPSFTSDDFFMSNNLTCARVHFLLKSFPAKLGCCSISSTYLSILKPVECFQAK